MLKKPNQETIVTEVNPIEIAQNSDKISTDTSSIKLKKGMQNIGLLLAAGTLGLGLTACDGEKSEPTSKPVLKTESLSVENSTKILSSIETYYGDLVEQRSKFSNDGYDFRIKYIGDYQQGIVQSLNNINGELPPILESRLRQIMAKEKLAEARDAKNTEVCVTEKKEISKVGCDYAMQFFAKDIQQVLDIYGSKQSPVKKP